MLYQMYLSALSGAAAVALGAAAAEPMRLSDEALDEVRAGNGVDIHFVIDHLKGHGIAVDPATGIVTLSFEHGAHSAAVIEILSNILVHVGDGGGHLFTLSPHHVGVLDSSAARSGDSAVASQSATSSGAGGGPFINSADRQSIGTTSSCVSNCIGGVSSSSVGMR